VGQEVELKQVCRLCAGEPYHPFRLEPLCPKHLAEMNAKLADARIVVERYSFGCSFSYVPPEGSR
jgi:hypothetical protein